jgi:hypothetical protein
VGALASLAPDPPPPPQAVNAAAGNRHDNPMPVTIRARIRTPGEESEESIGSAVSYGATRDNQPSARRFGGAMHKSCVPLVASKRPARSQTLVPARLDDAHLEVVP